MLRYSWSLNHSDKPFKEKKEFGEPEELDRWTTFERGKRCKGYVTAVICPYDSCSHEVSLGRKKKLKEKKRTITRVHWRRDGSAMPLITSFQSHSKGGLDLSGGSDDTPSRPHTWKRGSLGSHQGTDGHEVFFFFSRRTKTETERENC
ncbi:hypothetical protein GcC1_129001 [Golovinomyces cichoracearum]|uniref:Uncharacterized protein n=1 Tax=Golovinomyces cichoracearum TaxID=62708 RepID=A0A420I4Y3_9PEZI|nr:hypothetical protein GcC1_129001 [Golovinomyces cichoracearum]